jgi:hypothetical protein
MAQGSALDRVVKSQCVSPSKGATALAPDSSIWAMLFQREMPSKLVIMGKPYS